MAPSLFPPPHVYRMKSRSPMASVIELSPAVDGFRIPAPSHRHGTPSGPWPFLDLGDEIDAEQLNTPGPPVPSNDCDHSDPRTCNSCWSRYPQSLFPNWTAPQQQRSLISLLVGRSSDCTVHYVDVAEDARFSASKPLIVSDRNKDAHWSFMKQPRPTGTRLRAVFLDHLSGSVLQMIGTKYNIEPFFWSSSLGWIPSRYQESVVPNEGDHITVVLKFIRTVRHDLETSFSRMLAEAERSRDDHAIDIQAPLFLPSRKQVLMPDMLALHIVRSSANSTIISYHSGYNGRTTQASALHSRLHAAGRSIYWNHIFSRHKDPTFVFLAILWYALYAWDESLEHLYEHICILESRVIRWNDMDLTKELHLIRAHLHHYASLLSDFRKSVLFVLATENPALTNQDQYTEEERERSREVMERECKQLLSEIDRLEQSRVMQDNRVRNVINLGYASVNIIDSQQMKKLTEAALRDSAAMKQVAYLTMFFLPAGLAASIFGMNVSEVNPGTRGTIPHYIAVAVPLTIITIWAIAALEYRPQNGKGNDTNDSSDTSDTAYLGGRKQGQRIFFWRRVGWPIFAANRLFQRSTGHLWESKKQTGAPFT